jgi:methyl-accepting chemotaxis protein
VEPVEVHSWVEQTLETMEEQLMEEEAGSVMPSVEEMAATVAEAAVEEMAAAAAAAEAAVETEKWIQRFILKKMTPLSR